MKRLLFFLTFILFLLPLLVFQPEADRPLAYAQIESWVIERFDSNIHIPRSGKVLIKEIIWADFGTIQKHGIYRTIETTDMRFKLLGVRQDGVKAITKVSSVPKGKKIRIGDPDQTITGRHTYEISYEVGRVITRFSDHDEFYWDVTGNEWTVPIEIVEGFVEPEGEPIEETTCYTGRFGSREQNCLAWVSGGWAYFKASGVLLPGEGLTIVNKLPKDLVADPFYPEDILKPLWAIVGSLLAIAFVLRQWWRHGRDMWYRKNIILNPEAEPETKPLFARGTVVVEFDPPFAEASGGRPPRPLRPAEVGTLIDEKVDIHDISATIVDLAVRGYLKIGEEKEGRKRVYWFEKLREWGADETLEEYEKEVLRGIFRGISKIGDKVFLDDLKNKFYKNLDGIRDLLYARMKGKGYFVQRPDKVKVRYAWVGGGLLGLSILLLIPGFRPFWLLAPVLVSGLFLLVLSPFMPKKTAKGTEAVRRASGFKLFISKAEKYHQQFNERINRFDQFLPYAMVFGVVDKWVKVYQKLGVEPPQPGWYVAPYVFNASDFSSSMKSVGSALAATLPSTPAGAGGGSGFGGGGGFSGGGFGGGGGGGW